MATFDNTEPEENTAATTGFTGSNPGGNTAPFGSFTSLAAPANTAMGTSFNNTGASANSAATASFNNTGASDNEAAEASFDDTEPDENTAEAITMTGTGAPSKAPTSITMTGDAAPANTPTSQAFDDTGAVANVVDGEVAPVEGQALPNPLISVAHSTTLVAGTNYRVVVGNRAAPVTITLPDPPADNQIIEIMDASLQAATHNITVDPGTKDIDGDDADWVMDLDGMVLRIVYVASLTQWKIH